MRKALVGVLVGSLLLAIAACGGGSDPGVASATAESGAPRAGTTNTSSAPAPNLKSQLLTLDALPTGWAVDNSSDDSSGSAPNA